jgi:hypothetical protein
MVGKAVGSARVARGVGRAATSRVGAVVDEATTGEPVGVGPGATDSAVSSDWQAANMIIIAVAHRARAPIRFIFIDKKRLTVSPVAFLLSIQYGELLPL